MPRISTAICIAAVPFPIVYNIGDMCQGWETVERLAGHPDRINSRPRSGSRRDLPARQRQGRCIALHLKPSRSFVK